MTFWLVVAALWLAKIMEDLGAERRCPGCGFATYFPLEGRNEWRCARRKLCGFSVSAKDILDAPGPRSAP